jgi:hypothetical protein
VPNLQFLEGSANQSKPDTPFADWIAPIQCKPDKWAQNRQEHAIPKLTACTLAESAEFFNERRKLLLKRLRLALACRPDDTGILGFKRSKF